MSFLKDKKAQGALEYLLIIGGAIVLAAIVIAVVINISSTSKGDVKTAQDEYNKIIDIDINEAAK